MTDTQWSEPFDGPEMKALCLPGDVKVLCSGFITRGTKEVRLPADHPAVAVALHNRNHGTCFAYWPGGDEAPGDYDRSKPVLLRDGTVWQHSPYFGDCGDSTIIGYHKRTEQPAEVPQWAFRRAEELCGCNFYGDVGGVAGAFARYIAKREQPPVDPDLIEAREIAATCCERMGWNIQSKSIRTGAKDDSYETTIALAAIKRGRELAQTQP